MSEQPRIDKESDRPAYRQLADIVRKQIIDGELEPGAELPSKQELADLYGIAVGTVTDALRVLVSQGLIVTERGRRTKVRPIRVHHSRRYEAGKQNYNPDQESRFAREHGVPWSQFDLARVYETVPADGRVAKALGIDRGASVCRRRWIHSIDGVVLRVSWSYLDLAKFANTILTDEHEPPWPGGTIAQLRHLGYDVERVPTDVRARQGTEEELELLQLGPGSYVLESWRVQMAGVPGDVLRPAEVALHVYPADSAALHFDVMVGNRDWRGVSPD